MAADSKIIDGIPCKISPFGKNGDGYAKIFPEAWKGYSMHHRYVYAMHHKMDLEGKIVRHKCDNPGCIEISHLEIGTQADNVRDSVERGTHKNPSFPGETNPASLLNEDEVIEMRELFEHGWTHKQLAAEFKVHRVTVLNIVNRQTWKHLP